MLTEQPQRINFSDSFADAFLILSLQVLSKIHKYLIFSG